jgi:phenylalanyl-tRNA synthetase beta chain
MRISESWLREWVDPGLSTIELAEQLTMAGLEVDKIEPAAPVFSRVVVGRVLTLTPHPQADHLQVALVDVGQDAPLQIVCGASNVQVNMIAPTALVEAVLPNGQTIASSELRGVSSQGMLCSAKELGLAESSDGLMALPADSVPGCDVREYLDLDDQVIEIDLTPNRGDCLSMAGISREVGALNRCEVQFVATNPVQPTLNASFPVTLSAPADCPRYVGRIMRHIDMAAATPLWMQERLRRGGLRPVNAVVDVTNYVMLELGQPMHAFDFAKLSGGINVRRAKPGETLVLLNGAKTELHEDTLLIADAQGPLALAGIMGGAASAVTAQTQDIFLESAFFSPSSIAGRARHYGLHTDASHRFERGVDPQLQVMAMERATQLLADIAGGQAGPLLEAVSQSHLPMAPAIRLRPERIHRLLGLTIDPSLVSEILRRLGMAVANEGDHWLIAPPTFRFDMTLEANLIAEIGRIYGYDRLPSHNPEMGFRITPLSEAQTSLARLRTTLVDRGFQEAISYSFVDPTLQKALDPEHSPIELVNPISADLSVMRTNFWPGLIKALAHNQKRQQTRVRLFEIGLRFLNDKNHVQQDMQLAGLVWGLALPEQWGVAKRPVDFFDLKADVEALLKLTRQFERFSFAAANHPALHSGQTAAILHKGVSIGWLGALHPAVEHELDLEGPVFVFQLPVDELQPAPLPQFTELSKFPASRRDIALIADEQVTAEATSECIRAQGGERLQTLYLFDVYRGKGIPEGKKSMAFSLILQDFSRSLTDSAVAETMSKITAGLQQQLGVTLRV